MRMRYTPGPRVKPSRWYHIENVVTYITFIVGSIPSQGRVFRLFSGHPSSSELVRTLYHVSRRSRLTTFEVTVVLLISNEPPRLLVAFFAMPQTTRPQIRSKTCLKQQFLKLSIVFATWKMMLTNAPWLFFGHEEVRRLDKILHILWRIFSRKYGPPSRKLWVRIWRNYLTFAHIK